MLLVYDTVHNTAKVLVRTVNIKYVYLLFALRESGCLLYHNPV